MFWNISEYGHVGIADGNGGIWATSVDGKIGHASSVHYCPPLAPQRPRWHPRTVQFAQFRQDLGFTVGIVDVTRQDQGLLKPGDGLLEALQQGERDADRAVQVGVAAAIPNARS